jgi:hypothetical protein
MIKWKAGLDLKKLNVMWNDRHNLELYDLYNVQALKYIYEREWWLELGVEKLWIKREEKFYEKWWEEEKEKEFNRKKECLRIIETKICIYENIKRMNSSMIDLKEEDEVMNSYEEICIKYQTREMLRNKLKEIYRDRTAKYYETEKK